VATGFTCCSLRGCEHIVLTLMYCVYPLYAHDTSAAREVQMMAGKRIPLDAY